MTQSEVFRAIAKKTGHAVNGSMAIEELSLDSLEFAELLMELNIDVEKGADLKTVADIAASAQ